MRVGDLVRATWRASLAPPEWGKIPRVGIYLGSRKAPEILETDGYHLILSDSAVIDLPDWYWELEVISENR